jgi:hypothetical protein
MPGFMPGIHVIWLRALSKTWMAGTSPAMTTYGLAFEDQTRIGIST